ncbi:MAG: hypothetical protein R2875_16120 [Desulfobacterales bacterium]
MTIEDIEQVRQAFVDAAARAREAGFDGVEILGSGGYLITQFLSPVKNQRTDAYGGSFENRVRFPKEVIEDIRKQVGPDFPVTIRMAGNDFVAGSNTDAETRAFANVYEAAGVDAISVTGGWHETHVPSFRPVCPSPDLRFWRTISKNRSPCRSSRPIALYRLRWRKNCSKTGMRIWSASAAG